VVGPTTGRYFTTGDFRFLRIESQGDWTIETVPANLADIPLWADGTYTGSGNDVVRYTGKPGLLSYSDADDPNIEVRSPWRVMPSCAPITPRRHRLGAPTTLRPRSGVLPNRSAPT
jgi:hypothetical protein